jgi:hypothetical protein
MGEYAVPSRPSLPWELYEQWIGKVELQGASRRFPYEQIVTDFLNEPELLSKPLKSTRLGSCRRRDSRSRKLKSAA